MIRTLHRYNLRMSHEDARPLTSTAAQPFPSNPTLLFDADDTLWENNIFFERAIAAFISFLDHTEHSPAQIREHLNQIERHTVAERGYGTESFRVSLLRCFEDLVKTPATDLQHRRIMRFVDSIVEAGVILLPNVADALNHLARTHRLILVTKGDDLEQREKLSQSGLAPLFTAVEVLTEKTPDAYRELTLRHACNPAFTWMIGNSPKSDINPALAAGLHAVFIPHSDTWILEHEELATAPAGQQLLHLATLADLAQHL